MHPIALLRSACLADIVWLLSGESPSLCYWCARELEPVSPAGGRGTTGSFISRMQMSEVKDCSGTMKVWILAHESSKCNIEAN